MNNKLLMELKAGFFAILAMVGFLTYWQRLDLPFWLGAFLSILCIGITVYSTFMKNSLLEQTNENH